MQKLTLTTLLFMTASTLAMAAAPKAEMTELNPNNPFYTPKKGKGILSVESVWERYRDTDETTSAYFDSRNAMIGEGMYGLTDKLSVVVKISDIYYKETVSAFGTGRLASTPSVGVKYVDGVGMFKVGAEASYGFDLFEGQHEQSNDSLELKLTAGVQKGPLTLAAFGQFLHTFDYREKGWTDHTKRGTAWNYGLTGQYQATDTLSVDLGWTHQFKAKQSYAVYTTDRWTNEMDTFKVGLTWRATDTFYVMPYVAYHKMTDSLKEDFAVKDMSSYGLKFAVTF